MKVLLSFYNTHYLQDDSIKMQIISKMSINKNKFETVTLRVHASKYLVSSKKFKLSTLDFHEMIVDSGIGFCQLLTFDISNSWLTVIVIQLCNRGI